MIRKNDKLIEKVDLIEIVTSEDEETAYPFVEDKSAFDIDRDKEDKEVARFQRTGDLDLLDKVYQRRIPTLWNWTHVHYIPGVTCCSKQDLFAEFTVVFVTAAQKYDKKRGAFNTCLYTFLLNRIKNIKGSRYAKKRIPLYYSGPISGMIRSLDYVYNNKDGSETTLKDTLTDGSKDGGVPNKLHLEETLDILAPKNETIKGFLRGLSAGNSLSALLSKYKTKKGSFKLKKWMIKKLNVKRRYPKMVADLIEKQGCISGHFKLIDYKVTKTRLRYKVEMHKTEETEYIIKTIRKLKRNKEDYIHKIKGFRG